jgi:hypothetical protein
VKGGRNQEGYADPTATIAVGRVAKEEREQAECEAADKRAYDLIKVLKYIIKCAGFELTERVQVRTPKRGGFTNDRDNKKNYKDNKKNYKDNVHIIKHFGCWFYCLYSIFTLLETDIDNCRFYNCYHYYSMGV